MMIISIAFFFFDSDAYICHCVRSEYSHIVLHNVLLNIKWTNKICYERDQQVHLIVANNNPNPFAISSISEKFLSMLSRFRLYYRLVTVCILFSFVNGNTHSECGLYYSNFGRFHFHRRHTVKHIHTIAHIRFTRLWHSDEKQRAQNILVFKVKKHALMP